MIHSKVYVNIEMVGYMGDSINDIGMLHTLDGQPAFSHFNGIKFVMEHWKDYGIDVLERSFQKLEGLMIKSITDTLEDSYTQQFLTYRHRRLDLLRHQNIKIHAGVIFPFYQRSYKLQQDQDKHFVFFLKWGTIFLVSAVGSVLFVKLFVLTLEWCFGKRKKYE